MNSFFFTLSNCNTFFAQKKITSIYYWFENWEKKNPTIVHPANWAWKCTRMYSLCDIDKSLTFNKIVSEVYGKQQNINKWQPLMILFFIELVKNIPPAEMASPMDQQIVLITQNNLPSIHVAFEWKIHLQRTQEWKQSKWNQIAENEWAFFFSIFYSLCMYFTLYCLIHDYFNTFREVGESAM